MKTGAGPPFGAGVISGGRRYRRRIDDHPDRPLTDFSPFAFSGSAALAALSLVIWLYLLAFRGRFWAVAVPAPAPAAAQDKRVVVVIPARDEAAGIGAAVTSLLTQNYRGPLEIVLVDD